MFEKTVFHIDVNGAFLSWEAAYRIHHLGILTDLRTIPSAIGGEEALRHGIILAKSIPAKTYGIQTGMTIREALYRCPDLYLALPNYSLYQKCSKAFMAILREYTPTVEQYSIDEAFMDMTETADLFGGPWKAAQQIRRRISRELGFTVNVGISSDKILAKMAGDLKKPDQVHTLYPEEIPQKMWPLPVSSLFFVGRATARKLKLLGIHTIGELAQADPDLLKAHLKKQGETVWAFANGYGGGEVEAEPPIQKGYGNSTTLRFDVRDAQTARRVLLALSETVGTRLRGGNVKAKTVSVGIKSFDFQYASHQMILANATNLTREIYKYSGRLFDQLWDGKTPIRHLGLYASRLEEGAAVRQLELFDETDYEKLERLDRAVDEIRKKHGIDAVKRAAFLSGLPIDHMEGGVSREKRIVDYQKLGLI